MECNGDPESKWCHEVGWEIWGALEISVSRGE